MEDLLVSIVVPCYNAGNYIGYTIESVLSQTYKNWELLIVDDHSSDNSCEIIQRYMLNDKRIRLLHTDFNTGSPAEPRNMGITYSKGFYIALLDADDVWYPDKLKEQVSLLIDNKYSIVYSNGDIIDENGELVRSMKKAPWVDYRRTLKRNELSCSSVLMNKDIIGDLRFQNIPKEDFVFWLQLMKRPGLKAYNTNSSLYAYRLVNNSRSRDKNKIIQQQWHVLKDIEHLSYLDALYCFSCWMFRNLKKYYF